MITQTIKRWWRDLFSWWPWRRSQHSDYPHVNGGTNIGLTPDTHWTMTSDAPVSLPNATSVVVEQERGDDYLLDHTSITQDNPQPAVEEDHKPLTTIPNESIKAVPTPHEQASSPTPTFEQNLHFLRYLVRCGIVNEGFGPDQTPRQYRRHQ